MAGRKNNIQNTGRSSGKAKRSSGKARVSGRPLGILFWAIFFIVIAGLFLINQDRIRETLESTRVLDHLPVSFPRVGRAERAGETEAPEEPATVPVPGEPARPASAQPASTQGESRPAAQPQAGEPAGRPAAAVQPAASQTNSRPAENVLPTAPGDPGGSNPGTSPRPVAASRPTPAPQATSPETPPAARERAIYFARIDAGGTVIRTKVIRRLPVSDSPLTDSLRALLTGPSAEEEQQGIRSLIPPGTRLHSATTVRGSTAYVSFSEDFQYNTFGVEGYAAQLRQVIWTATEFSNIKDVQILIEGRRIDYLGESIRIGSPLSRESL